MTDHRFVWVEIACRDCALTTGGHFSRISTIRRNAKKAARDAERRGWKWTSVEGGKFKGNDGDEDYLCPSCYNAQEEENKGKE